MPQLDFTVFAPQLVWLAISFITLYVILAVFALPPLGRILAERKGRIEGDLAEAARLRDEAEQALANYETALAEAREKASAMAQEAREKAAQELAAKQAELQTRLDAQAQEAEKRLQKLRHEAVGHIKNMAGQLVGDIVQSMAGIEVSDKAAQKAVDKAFETQKTGGGEK